MLCGFSHYGDLAEIGHIQGFWPLSGERVGVNVEGGGGIIPTLCVEFCLVSRIFTFNTVLEKISRTIFYKYQYTFI